MTDTEETLEGFLMKFTIVTVCRNSGELVRDTIESVRSQRGLTDSTVHYLILDGASTDDTLAHIQDAIGDEPLPEWLTITVESKPDSGMYDALANGLSRADGDVVAYINAGDFYSPHAFRVVRTCFAMPGVTWLTGMRATYEKDGATISAAVPFHYSSKLLAEGHYGSRGRGRFLQQESTFWSGALNRGIDWERLRTFRMAGDQFMWATFAKRAQLYVVAAHLGGFRFHGGHISDDMTSYRMEAQAIATHHSRRGFALAPLHEIISWLPVRLRQRFHLQKRLITWDRGSAQWVQGRT